VRSVHDKTIECGSSRLQRKHTRSLILSSRGSLTQLAGFELSQITDHSESVNRCAGRLEVVTGSNMTRELVIDESAVLRLGDEPVHLAAVDVHARGPVCVQSP
jgi:hypothetical protein